MKPVAERKKLSVLGQRKNIFLHLQGEIFCAYVLRVQREFMWAGVMKLREGQIPLTLILLLNFQNSDQMRTHLQKGVRILSTIVPHGFNY